MDSDRWFGKNFRLQCCVENLPLHRMTMGRRRSGYKRAFIDDFFESIKRELTLHIPILQWGFDGQLSANVVELQKEIWTDSTPNT